MNKVLIERTETGDTGTFGILKSGSGFSCYTLELPWHENKTDISCIPTGVYICKYLPSPKHGNCYHVTDVPGRTSVEIHSANWAGDVSRGLKSQLLGCIAIGRSIDTVVDQKGLMSSKDAISAFEADQDKKDFQLEIIWRDGIGPEKEA